MDLKTISLLTETKIRHEMLRRKLFAFLVTAMAAFSTLVIGWSWFVKGYETQSAIVIQPVANEIDRLAFQGLVANTIRTKVTDSVLNSLLTKTKQETSIQSTVLSGDLDTLRKAILVKTRANTDPIKIEFTLLGRGSNDEQHFLKAFTTDFADALTAAATNGQFVIQNREFARYHKIVDELEQSVSQLEREIGEVNDLCKLIDPGEPGKFRVASHRKDAKDPPIHEVREIQKKISEFDLEFLRSSSLELKQLLNNLATGGQPYALPDAKPVGTPEPKQLLVLMLLAGAFGVVVASHYDPFAQKGFANLADVSHKLRIPVVAALPINPRNRNESLSESSEGRKLPWANRLTRIATGWLFAVVVLVAGFCFVSEEIREIFFRNPVDGFARAFWYFKR